MLGSLLKGAQFLLRSEHSLPPCLGRFFARSSGAFGYILAMATCPGDLHKAVLLWLRQPTYVLLPDDYGRCWKAS